MNNKVNIIIPSITISEELITCLKGISLLNYRNFIVSIVIDYENIKQIILHLLIVIVIRVKIGFITQ